MKNKKLVAYFSATSTTKDVAKRLANLTNADIYEIQPAIPYTTEDLNWKDAYSRSSMEMKNPHSRPVIATKVIHMDDYDTIWIGFPIWWYVAPTIIHTFIESYDFSGKTIIPFATSGGSGWGDTITILKSLCSQNTKWQEGRILNQVSDQDLRNWVQSLGD